MFINVSPLTFRQRIQNNVSVIVSNDYVSFIYLENREFIALSAPDYSLECIVLVLNNLQAFSMLLSTNLDMFFCFLFLFQMTFFICGK